MTKAKTTLTAEPAPPSPPKALVLRAVPRASELGKPSGERWYTIQRIDSGLVIGDFGPSKSGIGFAVDGSRVCLSAAALREIADLLDLHGVEVAA